MACLQTPTPVVPKDFDNCCSFCGNDTRPTSAIAALSSLRPNVQKAIDQFYPTIKNPTTRCRVRDWLLHMIRKGFLHGIEFTGDRHQKRRDRAKVLHEKVKKFADHDIFLRREMNLTTAESRKAESRKGLDIQFHSGGAIDTHYYDPILHHGTNKAGSAYLKTEVSGTRVFQVELKREQVSDTVQKLKKFIDQNLTRRPD
jgi:hypothetical protein